MKIPLLPENVGKRSLNYLGTLERVKTQTRHAKVLSHGAGFKHGSWVGNAGTLSTECGMPAIMGDVHTTMDIQNGIDRQARPYGGGEYMRCILCEPSVRTSCE